MSLPDDIRTQKSLQKTDKIDLIKQTFCLIPQDAQNGNIMNYATTSQVMSKETVKKTYFAIFLYEMTFKHFNTDFT